MFAVAARNLEAWLVSQAESLVEEIKIKRSGGKPAGLSEH
jgi:hypothetical protein